jgi:asparagine synthase (glutamine-hydrolysing)
MERALRRLRHRGPDGATSWTHPDGLVELGHTRLAIIDTSDAGIQPKTYGPLTITFNGEIYNYIELREELRRKGHQFNTDTDTEVLLALWLEYGPAGLLRCNGMWAFALWDSRDRTLYLARDRFGKKPLFYAWVNGRLVFASELKAIACFLTNVQPHVPESWVENPFLYEATEDTLLAGVRRLPAGHYGVLPFGAGGLTLHRYWNTLAYLPIVPRRYTDQVEAFREILLDAVRLRLRSDVPTGTALSGGVDSTAVFGCVHHLTQGSPPHTGFVSSLPGTPLDETHLARTVAAHHGAPLVETIIDPVEALERLPEELYLTEEFYHTPPSPMVAVYRRMRAAGVFVTLDGHGPDELFSGYDTFLLQVLQETGFHPWRIQEVLRTYRALSPADPQFKRPPVGWVNYLIQTTGTTTWRALLPRLPREIIKALSQPQPQRAITPEPLAPFNRALYHLFHTDNLPTLLRNYDRYAMAYGVESRMPFLDWRLVAFCFALPWTAKVRRGYTKALLRDAVAPFCPTEIIYNRTKLGFQAPVANWLTGPWKSFLQAHLYSEAFRTCPIGNPVEARKRLENLWATAQPTHREAELAYAAFSPYLWYTFAFQRMARPDTEPHTTHTPRKEGKQT